jgi:hypothetical protein
MTRPVSKHEREVTRIAFVGGFWLGLLVGAGIVGAAWAVWA